MKNLLRLFAALLFSATLLNAGATTTLEAPDTLIKRVSLDVLNTARNDKAIHSGDRARIMALVEATFLPIIDFERMTTLAVGRYWRQATPEQRTQLTKQFRDLLIHTYAGALTQVKDQKLQFRPLRASPDATNVVVYSRVLQGGGREPIELNYRLVKLPTQWKIYDINVMGAWLVQTYKGSFATEIGKSGIDGLIATLAEKNSALEKADQKK